MIVDTSALVSMVTQEPGFEALVDALLESGGGSMSAGNALEAAIVIDRYDDPVASRGLDRLRRELGVAIHPVTAEHVDIARQAYRDFGRGSGHPAKLNFGDCFAYALSVSTGQPLLYVGDDFSHTDVESALER